MPVDLVSPSSRRKSPAFVLTGRHVFIILCCFFGVTFVVNLYMAKMAITTFSGEVAANAYEQGLHFNNDILKAQIQESLGWRVVGRFTPLANGVADLNFRVTDKVDASISGLDVEANLEFLADRKRDRRLTARETSPGVYNAMGQAAPGVYFLVLSLKKDGGTKFQSRNRVMIQ